MLNCNLSEFATILSRHLLKLSNCIILYVHKIYVCVRKKEPRKGDTERWRNRERGTNKDTINYGERERLEQTGSDR